MAGALTRFEDLVRLPMGVSVNITSYSARMILQVAYQPEVRAAAGNDRNVLVALLC